MSASTEAPRPKAVLVSVQLPGVTDAEQQSSLKELKRLCQTLGFEVVGNSPAEFNKFLNDELARWKQVIDQGGIRQSD